jgi:hypothetical protein
MHYNKTKLTQLERAKTELKCERYGVLKVAGTYLLLTINIRV